MVRYTDVWTCRDFNAWSAKLYRPPMDMWNDEPPAEWNMMDGYQILRILRFRYGEVTMMPRNNIRTYRDILIGERVEWPADTDSCGYVSADRYGDRYVTCKCDFKSLP